MLRILGIETSCDDTAVGLIEINDEIDELNNVKILSNVISSQNHLHSKYGGIVPEIAARSHLALLPKIVDDVLKKNNLKITDINLIGYTENPGLLSSLLIGINFGKALGFSNNIPTFGVNHIKAHLLVNFMNKKLEFPSFGLIISGGHTELWYLESIDKYQLLIKTADDAIGEFFDKVGRVMNLPFPGGPHIEKIASTTNEIIPMTLPKILSFSGLKTRFTKLVEEAVPINKICKTMEVISTELIIKNIKQFIKKDELLIVGGGVSANEYLRKELGKNFRVSFVSKDLCTDNGVMIAYTAFLEMLS